MATKKCPFSGMSLKEKTVLPGQSSGGASDLDHPAASGRVAGADSRDPATTIPPPASSGCPFRRFMGGAKETSSPVPDPSRTPSERGNGNKEAGNPPQISVKAAAQAAGCPFHSQIPEQAEAPKAPGKCPFLASGGAQPSTPVGSDAPKCPMGFSSEVQQKLGSFHCVLCKSLLHDCVRTACRHEYCRACIERYHDCPICGADAQPLTAAPDVQGHVEAYIEAHGDSHSIWELEGLAGDAGADEPRGRANFLLQLGLRALAGGNLPSGEHRLTQCRGVLQAQMANRAARREAGGGNGVVCDGESAANEVGMGVAAGDAQERAAAEARRASASEEDAADACALATVQGCLGDCARAQGRTEAALDAYLASAALLGDAGGAEARQTLSVTLNKVAELYHMQGRVGEALPFYTRALDLRERLLCDLESENDRVDGGSTSPGWAPAALSALTGMVKTADAHAAAGDGAGAERLLGRARALLGRLEAGRGDLAPPQLQRLEALSQFVAQRGV
ncbi:hypothetical protein APUTEX25_000910 [Auxenochlorella protothecoides]|uniref:RING-type domain-containing protein n=1 Tax=Auxenochlorella protothecoides TaxID=3075 RepID=A0A1D2A9J5_AUXPR|nr:hypothetical protein APUTEX25_000910 [Auxenochlorella protothecoides]|eukprot:RMZ52791.1 hypothetical protein APUTEX25_000910 [Auxenochlorella protothecoides]